MARSGAPLVLSLLCAITFADATQLWSTQRGLPATQEHQKAPSTQASIVQVADVDAQRPMPPPAKEVVDDDAEDDFSPAREPTAEFRPVVQAKVKKVLTWLRQHTDEYESAGAEQKQELEHEAKKELVKNSGTRGFSKKLCTELWRENKNWAAQLTYFFCPALLFPPNDLSGTPSHAQATAMPAAPIRSAWLSQYLWLAIISNHPDMMKMVASNVEYWNGGHTYIGADKVKMILPVIGWPTWTQIEEPETWRCGKDSCIVPVMAWGHMTCKCFSKFNPAGLAVQVHINMACWR